MFQPIVPLTGYAGWLFLERTAETQREAFSASPDLTRKKEYFRENIGQISTAEELVEDRQLLEVALGAFGLDDDIDNKFFIQKILSEGTIDSESLANRLTDSRYSDLSKAFGFGDFQVPNTILSDFPDRILDRYDNKQFETAIGDQDNNLRLAMNFSSALQDVVDNQSSEDGRWFAVMGNAPLREVVEKALGLPSSFGALDIDLQLEGFKEKAETQFGSSDVSVFTDPEAEEKALRLFLLRSEIDANAQLSSAQSALTLISSINTGTLFG